MTTPRYSLVNSSRIRRTTSGGSWYTVAGPSTVGATFEICSHCGAAARRRGRARRRSRLGRGAHDEAGVRRAQAVEHAAQSLALVVGKALRDPVGLGLAGTMHHEAAREAHLLGEPGALGADRVLRDLHEHRLAVLEQPLDPGVALLDVVRVEGDVAAVQHAVLRRADVDERRLHAGQHVLHPAQVDVAVDRGVVGLGEPT